MHASAFCSSQRILLKLEHEEERAGLADKLTVLSAKECEAEGLSLLHLNLQSVRTGMYGRSVLTLTRNSSGIGSSGAHIKTGDEVRIFNPQLRNTPQEAAATIEGVVLHCNTGPSKADALKSASSDPSSHTGLVIEVAVSGEEEVDETLLASAASGLRLDLIANDATHSKMMNALNDLESVARTGCMTSRSGASGGGNVSPAAPLVSLLFGQAYERALTRTSRRQAPPAAALGGSGSARAPLPVDAAARIRPFGPINPSQVEAIENALQAPLLACIHGPPGTGKSTAVVELILQCVARGQRLLVCAPSNVAVDSLVERLAPSALAKLSAAGQAFRQQSNGDEEPGNANHEHWQQSLPALPMPSPRIVRLGHPARMSPLVLPHCLEAQLASSDDAAILRDVKSDVASARAAMLGGGSRRNARTEVSDREPPLTERAKDPAAAHREMSRPQLKAELKVLRKELRQREEASVANLLQTTDVVLSTCVGAASKLLVRTGVQFDVVIVDEAAQALEAACWIPLLLGRKAVLAGDHLQLAPTVKSRAAEAGGLGMTLFQRILDDVFCDGTVNSHAGPIIDRGLESCARLLDVQYRMNNLICDWASRATYAGRLKSHPSVAEHTLKDLGAVTSFNDEDDEDPYREVLLLVDTAGCDMHEDEALGSSSGKFAGSQRASSSNRHEALLVQRQVRALVYGSYAIADSVAAGGTAQIRLPPEKIGVVTPYNGQVDLLWAMLGTEFPTLDVKTVDSFQGGEKEAIVMSLVRSNRRRVVGFLSDQRRLNVAVTRARRHLCIVCDTATISEGDPTPDHFLRGLMRYMSDHGDHRSALEWIEGGSSGSDHAMHARPTATKHTKIANKKIYGDQRRRHADELVQRATALVDHLCIGKDVCGEVFVHGSDGALELIVHPVATTATTSVCSLLFPTTFDSMIRARIHEYCEIRNAAMLASGQLQLQLHSASEGLEPQRRLRVTVKERPTLEAGDREQSTESVAAVESRETLSSEGINKGDSHVKEEEEEEEPTIHTEMPQCPVEKISKQKSYRQFQPRNQARVKEAEARQAQKLAEAAADAEAALVEALAQVQPGPKGQRLGSADGGVSLSQLPPTHPAHRARPSSNGPFFAPPPAPELELVSRELQDALSAPFKGKMKAKSKGSLEQEEDDDALLELAMQHAQLEREAQRRVAHDQQYRVPLSNGGIESNKKSGAIPNPESVAALAAMRRRQQELAQKRKPGAEKEQGTSQHDADVLRTVSGGGSSALRGAKAASTPSKQAASSVVAAARAAVAAKSVDPISAAEAAAAKTSRVDDVFAAARQRAEAKALLRNRALAAAEAREGATGKGAGK